MSAINGIGQSLYEFSQGISANSPAQAGAITSSTTATDTSAAGSTTTSPIQGGGHHHHGHGGGFKKIEQAVTTALQSAAANGTSSSSSTDPNQTIEDAIAKVFQNSNASPSTTAATQNGDPDGDGDTDAPGAADGADAQQSFLSTLKSFGVDPEQFHQDFLAAVKDAQGGQVNPSTAFQSFPPGTFLDTTG